MSDEGRVRGERRHPEDRTLTVFQAFEREKAKLRALSADRFPVEDRVEAELTVAIEEALAVDAPHVGGVRQVLDRRRLDAGKPPPSR